MSFDLLAGASVLISCGCTGSRSRSDSRAPLAPLRRSATHPTAHPDYDRPVAARLGDETVVGGVLFRGAVADGRVERLDGSSLDVLSVLFAPASLTILACRSAPSRATSGRLNLLLSGRHRSRSPRSRHDGLCRKIGPRGPGGSTFSGSPAYPLHRAHRRRWTARRSGSCACRRGAGRRDRDRLDGDHHATFPQETGSRHGLGFAGRCWCARHRLAAGGRRRASDAQIFLCRRRSRRSRSWWRRRPEGDNPGVRSDRWIGAPLRTASLSCSR